MRQLNADLMLGLCALVWGTTFTIVQTAVQDISVPLLLVLRFGTATLLFVPLVVRMRHQLNWAVVRVGVLLGTLLFLGFITQSYGLTLTTPARAGFVTGLNVVLVPVLGMLAGQSMSSQNWAGVLTALLGLIVLSFGCSWPLWGCPATVAGMRATLAGDALVLLCAVAFAAHIVAVSRWATALPVIPVNAIQLGWVTVLALAALIVPGALTIPSGGAIVAAVYLGLIATAAIFAIQLRVQRFTSATHTALIFALEPIFAAWFSWLWRAEALTAAVIVGGLIMLSGVVVAELPERPSPWMSRFSTWIRSVR